VPGIKYVIDPGMARISRYSRGTKVQRLPIEPISQASANQRKGRCGRTSDGICIRLYSEEDFSCRPEFTDPADFVQKMANFVSSHPRVETIVYYRSQNGSTFDLAHKPNARAAYKRYILPLGN